MENSFHCDFFLQIISICSTNFYIDVPSDIFHVVSVKEKERSEYSGDADVVLLPDDNCQGLHVHHYQHNCL